MKLSDVEIQILQSGITIVSLLLLLWIINRYLVLILKRSEFTKQRRKVATRGMRFIASIVATIILLAIWGVEQESILLFSSSLLTILGVAFFAQWSHISNITAGLILYFNHPVKIGSYIKIQDKDIPVEGRVDDITLFFVKIVTDEGEIITVPTNTILQKGISIRKDQ